ncbi:hypothetical protein EDC01DRAFT_679809 [Geopyxis carbonaria]|nr:hypothetical protein EDC01DRAFT_679809 [Geopyxis carbonaria]
MVLSRRRPIFLLLSFSSRDNATQCTVAFFACNIPRCFRRVCIHYDSPSVCRLLAPAARRYKDQLLQRYDGELSIVALAPACNRRRPHRYSYCTGGLNRQ